MPRRALLASILILATACDKAKELAIGTAAEGAPTSSDPVAAQPLDLSQKPNILFQLFGEKDDPRMIPVAAIQNGTLKLIGLTTAGWRQFDAMYDRSGNSYFVFHDGHQVGTARVKQGMWEKPDQPLYTLPNCQLLTPLAAVSLEGGIDPGYTVELLASSAQLSAPLRGKPLPAAETERIARDVAYPVAQAAGISKAALDSLDFRGVSVSTGATGAPTVIATFIDPHVDDQSGGDASHTAHVFVIADRDASGAYHATFSHAQNGALGKADFRRYMDHLDINGDGVDEIFLAGWQYGGDTFLSVLGYQNGKWSEVFHGRSSWCLDADR